LLLPSVLHKLPDPSCGSQGLLATPDFVVPESALQSLTSCHLPSPPLLLLLLLLPPPCCRLLRYQTHCHTLLLLLLHHLLHRQQEASNYPLQAYPSCSQALYQQHVYCCCCHQQLSRFH
jgi:hypothetical protein